MIFWTILRLLSKKIFLHFRKLHFWKCSCKCPHTMLISAFEIITQLQFYTKIWNWTNFPFSSLKKPTIIAPIMYFIFFFHTDHSRRHGKTASTNTTSRSSSGGRSQKGGTLMHSASCPFKVNLSLWPSISSSICLSSMCILSWLYNYLYYLLDT